MTKSLDPLQLQRAHPPRTPADAFAELSHACSELGVNSWDVYGDFQNPDSFLRRFEGDILAEFGTEDAVFMPSGVMAQSIALLIHRKDRQVFVCDHSSHLILHEQEAYRHLLNMEAIVIKPKPTTLPQNGMTIFEPPSFLDIKTAISDPSQVSAIILELPHRELGGKCTSLDDIREIRDFCRENEIAFHCDGARIFEATTAYGESPKELSSLFDSIYVSFYKGLGGMSGAMLLGDAQFCEEARVWLRRFGGNLYTLMPYIVSSYRGYQKNWVAIKSNPKGSFDEKRDKLARIVSLLGTRCEINEVLAFDPPVPEVCMIHGYLKTTTEETSSLVMKVSDTHSIELLQRWRSLSSEHPAYSQGYKSMFELSIGEANGAIPEDIYLKGWLQFAALKDSNTQPCDEH